jgi:hypothetical protein
MAQKVVQYQAALQLAQGAPQLYNLPVLHRQMLEVLGIPNYQKLVPMEDDMKPRDPVTENQNILKGKPVKAFLYQDHQAHIAVHMSAMQDPKVQAVLQQAMGSNPQALMALQATMGAHISEHLGYEYRKQIEQAMGMDIPNYGEDDTDNQVTIPEDMEVQISKLAAQASQQLTGQHQQEAQAQANQAKQQDPLIQMQQQELQLKAQDLQRKVAKDQSDAQLEAMKIQVDRERIGAQQQVAGAQISSKMQDTQASLKAKQDEMAAKLGVDVALKEGERSHQKQQTNQQHDHAKFLAERQHQQAERLAQRQAQTKGGEVGKKKPEGFKGGGAVTAAAKKAYDLPESELISSIGDSAGRYGTDELKGEPYGPQGMVTGNARLQAAQEEYPFIKQHNPVVVDRPKSDLVKQSNDRGYAETFVTGETGKPSDPRSKTLPAERPGIEVYRTNDFKNNDLAGELMHQDKFANKIRGQLQNSLTPAQIRTLKDNAGDYKMSLDENMSEDAAMRNATDSAMRGYVVNQWPDKYNKEMNYSKDQLKLLNSLKDYTKTGKK